MFEILDQTHDKVIAMKVDGKLVHADYQKVIPMFEEFIAEHGSFRCYCEIENFEGITPHAMWDELKFDLKHCKDIERCAIVGDKRSHEWMAKISGIIFRKAAIKYFKTSEKDQAWQWINEGLCTCSCSCSAQAESSETTASTT